MAEVTRRGRWAVYGTNVLLAALAAIALAVLVNALVFWRMPRQSLRFDLTATRQYSLSQQTRKILATLQGDYRLVTLTAGRSPDIDQIIDLTEEYAARAPSVRAEQITAGTQLSREEALYRDLHNRYTRELQPARDALQKAQESLQKFAEMAATVAARIRQPIDQPTPNMDEALRSWLQQAAAVYASLQQDVQAQIAANSRRLESPLPDYADVRDQFNVLLTRLEVRVLTPSIQQFSQKATAATTPANVKDLLLSASDVLKQSAQQLEAALAALQTIKVPQEYQDLVRRLGSPTAYGCLVVMGPKQVRVLPMDDMFQRAPTAHDGSDQPRQTGQQFVGEEQITGALIAMSLKAPPLVVFVTGGGQDPIAVGGPYNHVASRLRALNFDVQQWSPASAVRPMGQAQPPSAPPKPNDGQPVVWVVLGPGPASPMNPAPAAAETQLADFVRQRLADKQGVMVLLSPSQTYEFQPSPLAEALQDFGLTVQLNQAVLRQQKTPTGQTIADYRHIISDWPQDSPITRALGGMIGISVLPSPMLFQPQPNATACPLLVVKGPGLWAERNLSTQDISQAKFDPNSAPSDGRFVVGYAVEKDNARLVAIADPLWATDAVTTYGQIAGIASGAGLAEVAGATFPANAELFVNSIHWLAHLDDIIAASPRTQDIRRFEALTPAGLAAVQWALTAGMPAAALLLGVAVWLVRRRT